MNGRLHLPREIDALDRCPDRRRRLELAGLDVEVADTVRGGHERVSGGVGQHHHRVGDRNLFHRVAIDRSGEGERRVFVALAMADRARLTRAVKRSLGDIRVLGAQGVALGVLNGIAEWIEPGAAGRDRRGGEQERGEGSCARGAGRIAARRTPCDAPSRPSYGSGGRRRILLQAYGPRRDRPGKLEARFQSRFAFRLVGRPRAGERSTGDPHADHAESSQLPRAAAHRRRSRRRWRLRNAARRRRPVLERPRRQLQSGGASGAGGTVDPTGTGGTISDPVGSAGDTGSTGVGGAGDDTGLGRHVGRRRRNRRDDGDGRETSVQEERAASAAGAGARGGSGGTGGGARGGTTGSGGATGTGGRGGTTGARPAAAGRAARRARPARAGCSQGA